MIGWIRQADDAAEEIGESADTLWEQTLDALPRIGVALGLILVGWIGSRGIRIAARWVLSHRSSPSFSRVMSKVAGWIFLFLLVLATLAITFPSVQPVDVLAGLGFFSVAVGFAFQDILENTLAGELVIIPNRDVYKGVIRVQTANEQVRSEFVVGIAYADDVDLARRLLEDGLAGVPGISDQPPPSALVAELGVSTVDVVVRIWTESRQWDRLVVTDRAIRTSKRILDDAGIEMPAEIVTLQGTPSFRAALSGEGELTPGGGLRTDASGPA